MKQNNTVHTVTPAGKAELHVIPSPQHPATAAAGRRPARSRCRPRPPPVRAAPHGRPAPGRRTGWSRWTAPQRGGLLKAGDFDDEVMRYHLYVQWIADQQTARVFAEHAAFQVTQGASLCVFRQLGALVLDPCRIRVDRGRAQEPAFQADADGAVQMVGAGRLPAQVSAHQRNRGGELCLEPIFAVLGLGVGLVEAGGQAAGVCKGHHQLYGEPDSVGLFDQLADHVPGVVAIDQNVARQQVRGFLLERQRGGRGFLQTRLARSDGRLGPGAAQANAGRGQQQQQMTHRIGLGDGNVLRHLFESAVRNLMLDAVRIALEQGEIDERFRFGVTEDPGRHRAVPAGGFGREYCP